MAYEGRMTLGVMKQASLVLLLGALVAMGTQFSHAATVQAVATQVTGKAVLMRPGSKAEFPLSSGDKISPGYLLKTKSGKVMLKPIPGTAVEIGSNTTVHIKELSVTGSRRNVLLDVKDGEIVAVIDKLNPSFTNFRIKTPQGVAAARGTTFSINVRGGQSKIVGLSGRVAITTPGGRTVSLGGGQTSTVSGSGSGAQASAPAPATPADVAAAVNVVQAAVRQGVVSSDAAVQIVQALQSAGVAVPSSIRAVAGPVPGPAPGPEGQGPGEEAQSGAEGDDGTLADDGAGFGDDAGTESNPSDSTVREDDKKPKDLEIGEIPESAFK